MTGAHFSARAIRANEDAIRKHFAARPSDSALDAAKSRIGRELGPSWIRAILAEVNRGTPQDIAQPAVASVIAWMIANSVATESDPQARMAALGRVVAFIEAEAVAMALDNATVDPGAEAYGETGGHA